MDPEIDITWDEVAASGGRLNEAANQAREWTDTYFTSQGPAAQGNPGFASGPLLVDYAVALKDEMHDIIDDLQTNGENIVKAARNVGSTDRANAEGFSREVTALTGLSNTAVPGPS